MDGYHPEGLEVFRVRLRKQVFGSEQAQPYLEL
jgi:hypothetical protein